MKKTLYDYLELDNKASVEEIGAAYQAKRSRLIDATDQESQNELKFVQQAYTVLSDQKQRAKYDQSLASMESADKSIIYYSNNAPGSGRHPLVTLIFLSVIAFAGYEVYQQYFPGHRIDDAHAQENSAPAEGSGSPANTTAPGSVTEPANAVAQIPDPAHVEQQQPAAQPSVSSDITDVNAVPIPNPETQRGAYVSFLSLPSPRAFVICHDRRVMTFRGSKLFVQNKLATLPIGCSPYAVDDAVVWNQ